jgi:hypothetical protein
MVDGISSYAAPDIDIIANWDETETMTVTVKKLSIRVDIRLVAVP